MKNFDWYICKNVNCLKLHTEETAQETGFNCNRCGSPIVTMQQSDKRTPKAPVRVTLDDR